MIWDPSFKQMLEGVLCKSNYFFENLLQGFLTTIFYWRRYLEPHLAHNLRLLADFQFPIEAQKISFYSVWNYVMCILTVHYWQNRLIINQSNKLQLYLKKYDCCEYVKFGDFFKNRYFANIFLIKVRIWDFFSRMLLI